MRDAPPPSVREQEEAQARRAPGRRPPAPSGEAEAMLVRRGFDTTPQALSLPFDEGMDRLDELVERLGHYSFRLFLRGAIQRPEGFRPEEATRYLAPAQAREQAEALVGLGLASAHGGRYRLLRQARGFGGTLEWYVARALRERLGFDVLVNRKFGAPGVGGDLDVVAAGEGKLLYLELKSSPPKHVGTDEVRSFLLRVDALRPDLALFVIDTALRLGDRVIPILWQELCAPHPEARAPRRVERELWALSPHVYVVNAKPDLLLNVGRAIAAGLRALAPAPW